MYSHYPKVVKQLLAGIEFKGLNNIGEAYLEPNQVNLQSALQELGMNFNEFH